MPTTELIIDTSSGALAAPSIAAGVIEMSIEIDECSGVLADTADVDTADLEAAREAMAGKGDSIALEDVAAELHR